MTPHLWQYIYIDGDGVPTEFARQLERELAAVTDQRDRLVEALRKWDAACAAAEKCNAYQHSEHFKYRQWKTLSNRHQRLLADAESEKNEVLALIDSRKNVRPLASLPTSKLRDKMDTPNDTPAPTKPRVAGCQQEPCSALVELVSFVENVVRYGALTHDTDKRKAVALLRRHNPTSEVLPRDNTPTVAVKGRPWGSGPCGSEMRLLD